MITKLKMQNFEGYTDSELELSAGVNVIIGESDAGKSALFRAFEWIRTNRPLGDGFRSEWGGDTFAEVWTDDGHHIRRGKGGTNSYSIDGRDLKAFGQNPPMEVETVLRMDDVNMQYQNEPPFLLYESPGEAARILNRAASIQIIDHTIRNIGRKIDAARREKNACQNQITDKKEALKAYANLPKAEEEIELLEKWENQKHALARQSVSLTKLIRQIQVVEKGLANPIFSKLKECEKLVQEVEQLNSVRTAQTADIKRLKKTLYQGMDLERNIDSRWKSLAVKEERFKEISPEICPLCGKDME